MKTIICYIRHGQTDWNKKLIIQGRQNHPLNDTGRLQAKSLGERMFKENITDFDVVIASPLDRAQETCKIVLNEIQLNKPIITDSACIEREFGTYDELEISEERYQNIECDNVEGMETRNELKQRCLNFVNYLVKTYPGKKIVVFTHSHFIKGTFMNFDKDMTFNKTSINNCKLNYLIIEDNKITYEYNK